MEAEAYPQEVLAEQEPRYLRRQKPLEIKRRKFGEESVEGLPAVAGDRCGSVGSVGGGVSGQPFPAHFAEHVLVASGASGTRGK